MVKKTPIAREEILHLANLAKLTLSEEEIGKFQKQLTETLDYIDNLNELKTDKVVATNQSINSVNITFTDGEKNLRNLPPEESLKNAPNKKKNFFVVKRIL